MSGLKQSLLDEISTWEIIDCHEHLPEESARTGSDVDALTLLSHYTHNDLITAGLSRAAYDRSQDHSLPLDERWALVEPYWERTRFTGYARAVTHAVQRFYGCDDLNRDTYQAISERMQAANTPGLYDRVLRDACHIRACLTQIGRFPEANRDLLIPILPCTNFAAAGGREQIEQRGAATGVAVKSAADFVTVMRHEVRAAKAQGMVGLKMVSRKLSNPAASDAEHAFSKLLDGYEYDQSLLADYLLHELLDIAAAEDLVVAVHCGLIWTNWGDFTQTHPQFMVPVLLAHQQTRFDLYHAGLPWVRETGVIGKTFPNVWLNLCWCHIISPAMTISALNEWLDLMPYTKILGFGGDYGRPVEKVYGHLRLALEDIATVLAGRVEQGLMNESQALKVAQAWLWDNPLELYRLSDRLS